MNRAGMDEEGKGGPHTWEPFPAGTVEWEHTTHPALLLLKLGKSRLPGMKDQECHARRGEDEGFWQVSAVGVCPSPSAHYCL